MMSMLLFREVLGKGAMKTVYKAFDEVMGIEVAWNQVRLNDVFHSPVELQRLYSEVHLLKDLNHPSIMKFHSSWVDPDRRTFNFITELFTSGTLREYRHKYLRVNIRAVKNWARQILRGLAYLHSHDPPVIHRDLKCDNIFVNGHLGQIKIGDLGLAAILRGSQHAHSVIGTPEFMAPELYEEKYTELVDIYSFGMCVLEMITCEYPYSECTNPAQIYKKVTSGKLPEAFYRIQDDEAREIIGRCLETASKRLPANELLLDPFLATDDGDILVRVQRVQNSSPTRTLIDANISLVVAKPTRDTDMMITGTKNPEDDIIYLKVQISDKDGHARNIFFSFDIVNDTTMDVATEMVKELEITDWDPAEIAEMIEKEIASLVPTWKRQSFPFNFNRQESFNCEEEDEAECGSQHPFYASSSHSSSQASLPAFINHNSYHDITLSNDGIDIGSCRSWLQDMFFFPDDMFINDDTASQSSMNSFKYSNFNYFSANELDDPDLLSPRKGPDRHAHCNSKSHQTTAAAAAAAAASRFCPRLNKQIMYSHQYHCPPDDQSGAHHSCSNHKHRGVPRIRSMVDIRRQLLHKSLVEDVINKRRMFKTVGAVENIGFQDPC
ncbi:probable serine/threonine-protein kinase WNK5 isoform X2 [Punica granatum]|uniref:non-specific serine/threonine protein kinase n=1 Tax=Punica granatum TaxID=22663 RepID=A0A6P8CZ27_PUNGR|nr:probable serine/threonine-protein kinase WNK5 isoform X2 [Punica granatum]